jgi:hypothetical protein
MGETELSRSIQRALRGLGLWVLRQQSSGRRSSRSFVSGEPGLPDLQILGPPAVCGFLEVKQPGKTLTDEQVRWHARAKRWGVRSAVVTSPREAVAIVQRWMAEDGRNIRWR